MTINNDGSPEGVYLQETVSRCSVASTPFSFLTVFFLAHLMSLASVTPEATFTYTAAEQQDFYGKPMHRVVSFGKSEMNVRICGFKTCHQANYVFMKKVEQISG